MAALVYHAVAAVDRLLGGDPIEPAPEPPAADLPDEFEESRPVDLDDCELCAGTGLYAVRMFGVAPRVSHVTCPSCGGNGERVAA